MAIIALKTQPNCKICKSADRHKIDRVLELRSRRSTDEAGVKATFDYVKRRCEEWGVPNLTLDNIKAHFGDGRHSEMVSDAEFDTRQGIARDTVELAKRGEPLQVDVEDALNLVVHQGRAELEAKIALTGKAGITVDQMIRASDALARRKQNQAQAELLRASASAIGGAIRVLTGTPEELDAEDAEIQEVENVPIESG